MLPASDHHLFYWWPKVVYWLAARFVSPRLSWAWPSICLESSPVMVPIRFCARGKTTINRRLYRRVAEVQHRTPQTPSTNDHAAQRSRTHPTKGFGPMLADARY